METGRFLNYGIKDMCALSSDLKKCIQCEFDISNINILLMFKFSCKLNSSINIQLHSLSIFCGFGRCRSGYIGKDSLEQNGWLHGSRSIQHGPVGTVSWSVHLSNQTAFLFHIWRSWIQSCYSNSKSHEKGHTSMRTIPGN